MGRRAGREVRDDKAQTVTGQCRQDDDGQDETAARPGGRIGRHDLNGVIYECGTYCGPV